ncbi:hypothetical protein BJN34_12765 [Cupriavidus necator]|uniref:Uncharacterized protein n=1 Tax=Cupriavidus necator TaxID=106590 RepID=A0A1U9UQ14_CUPNE|nr:hypothetical protein [Cupriavidus necator]AQV94752.1 hypothetical protein BJN34_12765 [Cupriavidus necator]
MTEREISYRINLANERALAALRDFAAALKKTDESGKNLSGVQSGLQGVQTTARATAGELAKVGDEVRSIGQSVAGLKSIGTVAAGIFIVGQALQAVKAALTGLPEAGIKFSASMETAELGMAGILSSMITIDGKAVSLNQALGISRKIIADLNNDALATAANSEELVRTFQAILGPALAAKMTLEQVRQLTVTGVNAVKSLGLNSNQVIQELRDLVQGGITPSGSTLATALGIKDEDIKRAKASSEGLFKFLMDRLQGFEAASARFGDTFDGRLSSLKEGATRAAAEGFKPLFEAIKEGLGEATDAFVTIEREGDKVKSIQLNPQTVQTMRGFAEGLVDLGQGLRRVAGFLLEHREAVVALGQAYAALKVFQVVRGVLEGIAGAITAATSATLGGDAATRAATAATLADLRAKVAHADAVRIHTGLLLAEAQAAVASATGMARLALAETVLVPAQQRAAAAASAHAAAQAALATAMGPAGAAGVLSRVAGLLGGPIGIVALLITGVAAWASFGSAAKDSLNGIDVSVQTTRDKIARMKRELKFGAGEIGENKAAQDALRNRIGLLEGAAQQPGPSGMRPFVLSNGEKLSRGSRDRELNQARQQLAALEELGKLQQQAVDKQAKEQEASIGKIGLKNSGALQDFTDLVKKHRSTSQKAADDIKEINSAFAKAVSETPELQKDNPKFDPKRLAEVTKARNDAIAEARRQGAGASGLGTQNAAAKADFDSLKATLDQELTLKKDALSFDQAENERAYKESLVGINAYYDKRLQITTDGIDAEKERNQKLIEELQAEQGRLGGQNPKSANERVQIATQGKKLETEIQQLNTRNLKLEQDRTQALAENNSERDRATRLLKTQGLGIETDVAAAVGTLTRAQIEANVRARNRDLVEQASKNPDLISPAEVEQKIRLEVDEADFERIKGQIDQVMGDLQRAGQLLQFQGFDGDALEIRFRPFKERALPVLESLNSELQKLSATSPSVQIKVKAENVKAQLDELGRPIINLQNTLENATVSGFGTLFQDIVNGAKSASEAVNQFAKSVVNSLLNAIGQKLGRKLFDSLFSAEGVSGVFSIFGLGAQAKAEGGYIRGPGTTTSDSIPALLSDQEYVVRASAVRDVGVGFLNWVNRGGAAVRSAASQFRGAVYPAAFARSSAVARFAGGGLVSAPAASGAPHLQPAPTSFQLQIPDSALHWTLQDWLGSELARMAATR